MSETTNKLSNEALQLLAALFNKQSNLQLPAGAAEYVLEIRKYSEDELKARGIPLPQAQPQPEAPAK